MIYYKLQKINVAYLLGIEYYYVVGVFIGRKLRNMMIKISIVKHLLVTQNKFISRKTIQMY